jgi:GT2 family glycosyltransferase
VTTTPLDVAGIWCPEVELSTSAVTSRVPIASTHTSVRALVRLHGRVVGYVTIPAEPDTVPAEEIVALARQQHAALVAAMEDQFALSVGADAPSVSVVVCTRNRSAELGNCLTALRALTYPNLEIVIVDNAPADDSTERAVAAAQVHDPRLVYVREPRPGLSAARNRGLATATGELVAYTDDDVSVDAGWLEHVVDGFAAGPNIACVTGMVCPASLTTGAELYFDSRTFSWSGRTEARTYDLHENAVPTPLYPYSTGMVGTGANFSFRRQTLLDLGGFDEALGAGSLTRGGEDLDIFARLLRQGHAIRYVPSALVWHHHRTGNAALVQQMYGYGTGLTAYATKLMIDPATRRDVLRRIPGAVAWALRLRRSSAADAHRPAVVAAPRGALWNELRGFVAGPLLYLVARRRATTATRTE